MGVRKPDDILALMRRSRPAVLPVRSWVGARGDSPHEALTSIGPFGTL